MNARPVPGVPLYINPPAAHGISGGVTNVAMDYDIPVDTLGYLPVDLLGELVSCDEYCAACFDGKYPAGIPADTRKDRFEEKLSKRQCSTRTIIT